MGSVNGLASPWRASECDEHDLPLGGEIEFTLETGEFDELDPLATDSGSEVNDDEASTPDGEEPDQDDEETDKRLTWSEDYDMFTGVRERFQATPGPTIQSTSPVELFTYFWDRALMESIADMTNSHARKAITTSGVKTHSRLKNWTETSPDELYRLMAVMILMSHCVRGRVEEYWSTGVMGMPEFRRVMTVGRFLLLMRLLRFADESNAPSNAEKGLELKSVIDSLNVKFGAAYIPRREVCVAESVLRWKGELSWAQCIGRVRGIKTFELCESVSGYVHKIIVNTGKKRALDSQLGIGGATADIVVNLIWNYLGKGYTLYMDSNLNSIQLTRFLKWHQTDVVGTYSRKRAGVPDAIKTLEESSLPRGAMISRHCGDVSFVAWNDATLVTAVSTFHKNERSRVCHKTGEAVGKPAVICDYNEFKGGVALKDSQLSDFLFERTRGTKWYIKLFRRLLNISIMNAYIVYALNHVIGQKMSQREFRFKLAEELRDHYGKDVAVVRDKLLQNTLARLDSCVGHFPVHVLLTKERSSAKDNRYKRQRCVRCTGIGVIGTSSIMCSGCQVFLCIGECWRVYHTVVNFKIKN